MDSVKESQRFSILVFFMLCCSGFFCFYASTFFSIASLVFPDIGYNISNIGILLSIYGLPVSFGNVVGTSRFTELGKLSALFLCGVYILYFFSIDYPFVVYFLRIIQGFFFGILMSFLMTTVKKNLPNESSTVFFGYFSALIPLSYMVGPYSAFYLWREIHEYIFIIGAISFFISFVLLFAFKSDRIVEKSKSYSLSDLLRILGRFKTALLTIFFTGLMFGLIPSFMASVLKSLGLNIFEYFFFFGLSIIFSRIFILPAVTSLPSILLSIFSLLIMSFSTLILIFINDGIIIVVVSSVFFGISYSIIYPTLSMYIAKKSEYDIKDFSIGVYNAVFNFGIFIMPLIFSIISLFYSQIHSILFVDLFVFVVSVVLILSIFFNRKG